PRPAARRLYAGEVAHDVGVFVEDGRDEDRRGAIVHRSGEPLGGRRGRERGNLDDRDPFLRQTVEPAADRVELSGRRYEAGASPQGQRREDRKSVVEGKGGECGGRRG